MGKRLFRIFQKDVSDKINGLLDQEINIITRDNRTFHGILMRVDRDSCIVKDLLSEKHKVNLNDIVEIIYDKESAY